MERLKNFLKNVFLWRSPEKILRRPFFFWRALALVSLVLGLGLENSCPWPREGLSSETLSLALASDFFCVLGLEPCVLDSTSACTFQLLVEALSLCKILVKRQQVTISDLPSYDIFVPQKLPLWKIYDDVIACDLWFRPPPIKNPGYAYKSEIA